MLILPPGHGRDAGALHRFTLRERWILGGVLAVVAALVVVVVISLGSSGHHTGNGCIDVKFPIAIGSQELYECGDDARTLCASANASGQGGVEDRAIAVQCRKVGLPVG